MEWNTDFVSDSEKKIHYYFSGQNKPPLILLHGAMDNGLCWIHIANKLTEKYNVIMPDARGHGLTEIPKKEKFSPDLMADDVAFIIEQLNLKKPQLIGHSMGGMTATLAAAKYPDLIHKIVLEDPPFLIEKFPRYSKPFLLPLLATIGGWLIRGDYDKLLKRGKKGNPTWPEEVFKPWAESKVQYKKNNRKYLLGFLRMKFYWKTYLKEIKCPSLLITADKGMLSDKRVELALELCEHLKWIKINGAGHNIRREQPIKYMESITKFLD